MLLKVERDGIVNSESLDSGLRSRDFRLCTRTSTG